MNFRQTIIECNKWLASQIYDELEIAGCNEDQIYSLFAMINPFLPDRTTEQLELRNSVYWGILGNIAIHQIQDYEAGRDLFVFIRESLELLNNNPEIIHEEV